MAEHTPQAGYEATDFSARGVVLFVIGLVIMVVISGLLMLALMGYWSAVYPSRLALPLSAEPGRAPVPRLQTAPWDDLKGMRQREDAILNNYGWVDRASGTVHIPIQRAMKLLAQRGFPVRTQPKLGEYQPQAKEKVVLPPPVQRLGSVGNP